MTVPSPTLILPKFLPVPFTSNVPAPILDNRSPSGLCTCHTTFFPSATDTPAPNHVVLAVSPVTVALLLKYNAPAPWSILLARCSLLSSPLKISVFPWSKAG